MTGVVGGLLMSVVSPPWRWNLDIKLIPPSVSSASNPRIPITMASRHRASPESAMDWVRAISPGANRIRSLSITVTSLLRSPSARNRQNPPGQYRTELLFITRTSKPAATSSGRRKSRSLAR